MSDLNKQHANWFWLVTQLTLPGYNKLIADLWDDIVNEDNILVKNVLQSTLTLIHHNGNINLTEKDHD